MDNFKSNPSNTILVIVTGLLIFYYFLEINFLFLAAVILALTGVFSSYLSLKVEFLWFKLALVLGLVIPNIILGIIFYFFFFPISVISRIFSKNLLKLKNNSNSTYYDVDKSFSKNSFKNTW
ncbi:hypothetical protein OA521_02910 [bacterium]|nr:hypothetical protein [bacterium]